MHLLFFQVLRSENWELSLSLLSCISFEMSPGFNSFLFILGPRITLIQPWYLDFCQGPQGFTCHQPWTLRLDSSSQNSISINTKSLILCHHLGLPRWHNGKESACQCSRCGFHLWVRKIPWRRKWQPTPVFVLGKLHGQRSWRATVHSVTKSWTWLTDWAQVPTYSAVSKQHSPAQTPPQRRISLKPIAVALGKTGRRFRPACGKVIEETDFTNLKKEG